MPNNTNMEELKPRFANSCPLTPLGFLERASIVYGDSISVVYNDLSYTWSQTHTRCLRVASCIESFLGVKKGQVVSVVAPNIPPMYELNFAVPMAGVILNNINTRLNAVTISVMLRHSESKLVFVDQLSVRLVLDAVNLFPKNTPTPLLVLITDESITDQTSLTDVKDLERFVCCYEELVEKGSENFKWVRPVNEWDPIVLNYTSGTTSSPKGVVHSHRGVFVVTLDSLIDWGVPKQPVYLWTLPMFHANGWGYTWGTAAVGATNVCLRRFDEIKDRSKDVIISGGENVSSVEVESALYSHPAVDEAAVVACPDEYWGETPLAFVTLKKGAVRVTVTEKEILEYCREKLAHFMVPKVVVFRDKLPKTSTGKIQKFTLKEIVKSMGYSSSSSSSSYGVGRSRM
ncbi:hypothetical protein CsatA_005129 [Cannabis sativa]